MTRSCCKDGAMLQYYGNLRGIYGIKEVELIRAVGLDIVGADVEGIMLEHFRDEEWSGKLII